MRTLSLVAAVALIGLMGCENNKKKSGNAGAVSGQKAECSMKEGSMGATGQQKSGCCGNAGGSMGAVSREKKAGCCSGQMN